MTDEEIIELAWQYGDTVTSKGGGGVWEIPNIVGFARAMESRTLIKQKAKWYLLGAEDERRACAAICDAEMEENAWESNASVVLNNVAAEIRARGE